MFFFFQAEDGIRDLIVTGVQTCALPIFRVEMRALGLPLQNVLRLDRWRRPREIGWVSESGLIKQEGGFTFEEVPQGVRIELRIAYQPPASVLGPAIARRLDYLVRRRLG